MTDIRLSDEEWDKMREFLRQQSRADVGRDKDACRRFVEVVKCHENLKHLVEQFQLSGTGLWIRRTLQT